MLNIIEWIAKSICLNWHGKYLQRCMLSQSDLFLLSSSTGYRQQVLALTSGGRVQWEGADTLDNISGYQVRSAVCSRDSDYFLLCFTSTEVADLFHSCGPQTHHQPVSSQTLFGCSRWDNTSIWSPVLAWETQTGHQEKNLHNENSSTLEQAIQKIYEASILGDFRSLSRQSVIADLICNPALSKRLN